MDWLAGAAGREAAALFTEGLGLVGRLWLIERLEAGECPVPADRLPAG
jgi:hypothetical protein